MLRVKRRLLALTLKLAVSLGLSCGSGSPYAAPLCKDGSYESNGAPIRARLCLPRGVATSLPGVVYLHGADGAREPFADFYRTLTGHGFAVLAIAYFSQTPAPGPNPGSWGYAFEHHDDAQYVAAARTWPRVISDGISYLQQQPAVDRRRIGVIGYSLGGAMALRTAVEDARFRAVVSLSGFLTLDGFPEMSRFVGDEVTARAAALPPVLALHGERDQLLPTAQALAIRDAAQAAGRLAEAVIDPDADHYWGGRRGRAAAERIAAFLERTLKG